MSSPQLVLVGVGAFGDQVTRLLLASRGGADRMSTEPSYVDGIDRAFADGAHAAVVALWRPSAALCEQIDELVFRRGRAWLPVVLDHPHVIVGPWAARGRGPCFRCYQDRRAQHDLHYAVRSKLEASYDSDPSRGPGGYLPHHARVAAGMAEWALRRALSAGSTSVDQVAHVNILSGRTSTHRLIPLHGCSRCQPDEPAGARRDRNRALAELVPRRRDNGDREPA